MFKPYIKYRIFLTLTLGIIITSLSIAQEEKQKAQIRLNYVFSQEKGPYLTTTVRTREGRKYRPVEGVIINLYLNEATKAGMMGNITTNQDGEGIFMLPDKFSVAFDTLVEFNFIASLKNDPNYQDTERDLTITKAKLELELVDEDSIKKLKAVFHKIEEDGAVPLESEEIKFFVERIFSLLPIGGEYTFTDEDGVVIIPFPQDLPGDVNGKVRVFAKVLDHDDYGTLEVSSVVDWGKPINIQNGFKERTLWASRDKAPVWLLIIPNLMIIGVWGVIIYLIFRLIKLRKLGNAEN